MKATEAIELLKQLIAIPSFSKEEDKTADVLEAFLRQKGVVVNRKGNNLWARNQSFSPDKPSILLNSHHDTVKPNSDYTVDPFLPSIQEGKLYGLGSNDAGASLVSLLATFLSFNDDDLDYNLIFLASAEEEISGKGGIESVLEDLPELAFAIVGEPTQMQMAIAEKGLMVLDCTVKGQSGHAARNEGVNAIYKALPVIQWFESFEFEKVSKSLGPVKMTVTQISAGQQHNVVPDQCQFVVDVRSTDAYANKEILAIIQQSVECEVKARSTRLNPSSIGEHHPIVKQGKAMGLKAYGSPTLSDQALLSCPSLKIGPGDSARSHTANEYVFLHEIEEGIELYKELLTPLLNPKQR